MNKRILAKKLAVSALAFTFWVVPIAAIGQTRVTAPKNKFKVQDDVKIGNDAAAEIDKQFPFVNDSDTERYVARVGERLVASIPVQFRQPAFNYRFKVVNARDINAFALPGGPMYVNRGMIEAARNEGEMAGVMAHEITHVALRHATAQATETQKYQIGSILGQIVGAVIGGGLGQVIGAGSQIGFGVGALKYSRGYETQADMLGAQIMADAGYDPRDLANMFRTIAGERNGTGAPEWLSSHPDPGNRYEKINREAQYLRIQPNAGINQRDFFRIKDRLTAMPRARSMAEIEKDYKAGVGTENPTASGRYSNNVPYPTSSSRAYSGSSWLRLNVPSNWREFATQNSVQFAPDGAYGDQGITHGVMIGIHRGQNTDLRSASQSYVDQILKDNRYLRQQNNLSSTNLGGRQGYTAQTSGNSPVTGRSEIATIYTTHLRNGDLFYAVTVVPGDESYRYNNTFRSLLNSIRFND